MCLYSSPIQLILFIEEIPGSNLYLKLEQQLYQFNLFDHSLEWIVMPIYRKLECQFYQFKLIWSYTFDSVNCNAIVSNFHDSRNTINNQNCSQPLYYTKLVNYDSETSTNHGDVRVCDITFPFFVGKTLLRLEQGHINAKSMP
jgi:hypothetical protein